MNPESYDAAISVDAKRSYTGTASTSRPPIPEKWVQVAGHRFYSPELGRWLNRDPIGERGGVGLYLGMQNNPLCLIDPDGHSPVTTIVSALAAAMAALGVDLMDTCDDDDEGCPPELESCLTCCSHLRNMSLSGATSAYVLATVSCMELTLVPYLGPVLAVTCQGLITYAYTEGVEAILAAAEECDASCYAAQ